MTKILFVCSSNIARSPTFETYFKEHYPELEIRSSGIYHGYPHQMDEELIAWADKIFVMDISHEKYLFEKFNIISSAIGESKLVVIGVSDEYERDSPTLKNIIAFWDTYYFKNWYSNFQDKTQNR